MIAGIKTLVLAGGSGNKWLKLTANSSVSFIFSAVYDFLPC
jgi:hypothetical protein